MLIKVNGGYLDLNNGATLVLSKRIKRFQESLDGTDHDFSYAYEIPNTAHNFSLLGFPSPDASTKQILEGMACEIQSDDGITEYRGSLFIQTYTSKIISVYILSGNYEWFTLLQGEVSSLGWTEYDSNLNEFVIGAAVPNTDGLVFPLLDLGGLASRSTPNLKAADFTGALYVKTIFHKMFYRNGIKLSGNLFNDWLFNNIVFVTNNKNKNEIEKRSTNAGKTSNQTIVAGAAYAVVQFQDDSNFPYQDGASNLYDNSTYRFTADVDMTVRINVSFVISMNSQLNSQFYRVNLNGSTYREYTNTYGPGSNPPTSYGISLVMNLSAGDYIQIDARSTDSFGVNSGIQLGSTFRITPIFIYKVWGESLVPTWSQQKFVLSILNLFNVISGYNAETKTVTFDIFEKLKSRTPLDISEYLDSGSEEVDLSTLSMSFAKSNYLMYEENDDEDLREYNVGEYVKYGHGVITTDRRSKQGETTIVKTAFTTPVSYINRVFDASLERVKLLEMSPDESTELTSVTDASGIPRFNIPDAIFQNGDLVRIEESTYAPYNGDWYVDTVGTGYIELRGQTFKGNSTGRISKLVYEYTDNDGVYLLVEIPGNVTTNFRIKVTT